MSTLADLTHHSLINEELEGKVSQKLSTTSLRYDAYILLRNLAKSHTISQVDFLSNILRALSLFNETDTLTLIKLGTGYKLVHQLTEGLDDKLGISVVLPKYQLISETRYAQLLIIERNQLKD